MLHSSSDTSPRAYADPGALAQLRVLPAADHFIAGTLEDVHLATLPGKPAVVYLPYALPPVPYAEGDAPWAVDAEHAGLDSLGRPPSYRESLYGRVQGGGLGQLPQQLLHQLQGSGQKASSKKRRRNEPWEDSESEEPDAGMSEDEEELSDREDTPVT